MREWGPNLFMTPRSRPKRTGLIGRRLGSEGSHRDALDTAATAGNAMTKQERLYTVKEIISTSKIANQNDLLRELRRKGVRVTQATLSRDLRQLGASRSAVSGRTRYTLEPRSEVQILRPLVGAEVLSIDANENLIVVHTLPGCANTVAEFLDMQANSDIIGTVAGDNTLMVIPRSQKRTKDVMNFLKHKLIEGRNE